MKTTMTEVLRASAMKTIMTEVLPEAFAMVMLVAETTSPLKKSLISRPECIHGKTFIILY